MVWSTLQTLFNALTTEGNVPSEGKNVIIRKKTSSLGKNVIVILIFKKQRDKKDLA